MNKAPNYYVSLTKSVKTDKGLRIGGVASGSLVDVDNELMGKEVLDIFVDSINRKTLPLKDGHDHTSSVASEVGIVDYARLDIHGTEYEMYIEAGLDEDHPGANYIIKKIEKGKKIGFSIEGIRPVRRTVLDKAGKFVKKIISVIPKAVAVTPKPAYEMSFAEVLHKSVNSAEEVPLGYSDYPKAAQANAKKVLTWYDEYGDDVNGVTPVLLARVKAIVKGVPLTRSTVNRMASQKQAIVGDLYEETPWRDAEYIKLLAWGGTAGVEWAATVAPKKPTLEKSPQEPNEILQLESDNIFYSSPNMEETAVPATEQEVEVTETSEQSEPTTISEEAPATADASVDGEQAEETEEVTSEEDSEETAPEATSEEVLKSVMERLEVLEKAAMKTLERVDAMADLPLQKKSLVQKSRSEEVVDETPKDLKSAIAHNFNF